MWSSLYGEVPSHVQPTASFLRENTVCQFPWWQTHCFCDSSQKRSVKWHLLLDLFVKHKVSLGVFIYHNNGDLCTAIHNIQGPVARRKVQKIMFVQFHFMLWMCIVVQPCEAWLNPSQPWLEKKKRMWTLFSPPFLWESKSDLLPSRFSHTRMCLNILTHNNKKENRGKDESKSRSIDINIITILIKSNIIWQACGGTFYKKRLGTTYCILLIIYFYFYIFKRLL